MPSINEILEILFGGKVTAEAVANIIVLIYAIVLSFLNKRATTRAITADRSVTAAEKEVQSLKTEVENLKTAIGGLSDLIVTAFLSSGSLDTTVKKELGTIANRIEQEAHVTLSATSDKILQAVLNVVPSETIVKKKEEAAALIKETADKIQQAKDDAKDMISKLTI